MNSIDRLTQAVVFWIVYVLLFGFMIKCTFSKDCADKRIKDKNTVCETISDDIKNYFSF